MSIAAERTRRDIEFLSRAGLDLESFITESMGALGRVVPSIGSCLGTLEPATGMITGTYKYGALAGDHAHDAEWCFLEYGEPDETSYRRLGERGVNAVGMHLETGGRLETSPRLAKLLLPVYGVGDELRVVFRERDALWGGVCLFRSPDAPPFDASEVAFAGSLSSLIARGIRTGILVRIAHEDWGAHAGPSVLIVSADGELRMTSPGILQRLADVSRGYLSDRAPTMVWTLVAAARRYAEGHMDVPPSTRVRASDGTWLVLHAAPLYAANGPTGDVAVTIEEARAPEILPLVVAAFDLTERESEVTALVLRGMETKEIGAALHLSPYTVQDHLKVIFDKAGVHNRRELIAKVYVDQYAPRVGTPLGTSGAFAEFDTSRRDRASAVQARL